MHRQIAQPVRFFALLGAVVWLSACGSSDATGPSTPAEATRPSAATAETDGVSTTDTTCRSGYHIAYREDGTAYCAPD